MFKEQSLLLLVTCLQVSLIEYCTLKCPYRLENDQQKGEEKQFMKRFKSLHMIVGTFSGTKKKENCLEDFQGNNPSETLNNRLLFVLCSSYIKLLGLQGRHEKIYQLLKVFRSLSTIWIIFQVIQSFSFELKDTSFYH